MVCTREWYVIFDKQVMILLPMSDSLQVRDIIPGDIYLKPAPVSYTSRRNDFDEYPAIIDDHPKIVCVFRAKDNQKEQVIQVCYFSPLFMLILTLSRNFIKKQINGFSWGLSTAMHRPFCYEIYSDLELDIQILSSFLVYAHHQLFQLLYSMVSV